MNHSNKVMLGLSGGVDSATCAGLLLEQGYNLQPILMHNWQQDAHCHIEDDMKICQQICQHFGLELEIINFANRYRQEVFDHCLYLFQKGLTPNPDILCNRQIKFEALKHYALEQGYDYLATGHYAQCEKRDGENALLCAPDLIKDQTYFLSQLSQKQLDQVLFPIGHLEKSSVRQFAQRFNLPNAQRKDSTGICFIGERRFDHFLKEHLLTQPGDAVDVHGNHVGSHQGLFFYTLGQRRRLGIGGIKSAAQSPWYVLSKDLKNNQLILTQKKEDLLKSVVKTEKVHMIRTQISPSEVILCKLRHGPHMVEAKVSLLEDTAIVEFSSPQEAPTPGQYLVFYRDNECIGSAMIIEQLQ
ncbi:tRNA 2-thiouridine(34) synthase MnmA [Gammaproteobacteria bacterium]|nr:tRNA 2-thiouridine(34) synthase MnmA [Gammaproteobacteria bacterium]